MRKTYQQPASRIMEAEAETPMAVSLNINSSSDYKVDSSDDVLVKSGGKQENSDDGSIWDDSEW